MDAHFLTPKAEVQVRKGHFASVAIAAIAAGETVAGFGGGCISGAALAALPLEQQGRSIQIDEDLHMAGSVFADAADMVNHSCSPNCGISGGVLVVAMHDIAIGDELTYDYAMTDGSITDEFTCSCGSPKCRGTVTGNDWALPELQLAYRGYFSPYLAKRIAGLVSIGAERRAFAL
jgi:hypothetical protein